MKYSDLIQRLYSQNLHHGIKLGLENSLRLNQALGNPSLAFPSIHIAGTNGKGSVATKIAKTFQLLGLKVGLYTSPHLSCFRERIKINESMISEKDLEDLLPPIFSLIEHENIPATFFEITTLLAFSHYAREKVDIAILETGLGGRLDATNIVIPKLTAITSISLDHTEILGNSLELIAEEKAGIIKPNIPVVIGPNVPFQIIERFAKKNNSPCIQVKGIFSSFEEENCAIAKKCLETLNISQEAISEGIKAKPSCRMEIIEKNPHTVVLDVAHNPDGLSNLIKSLKKEFPHKTFKVIFGISKNKNVLSCLKILREHSSHFYPVEAENGRGIPVKDLFSHLTFLGVPEHLITMMPTISHAIEHALNSTSANQEIILICGSFFIMSEARKILGIIEPSDLFDINERLTEVPRHLCAPSHS